MALNVKSAEVEGLARKLAAKTGLGLTEVIHRALVREAAHLERMHEADIQRKMEKLKEIQASVRAKLGPNPPPLTKADYDDLYE